MPAFLVSSAPTHLLLRLKDEVVPEGDARAGEVLQVPGRQLHVAQLPEGADHLVTMGCM